MPHNSWTRLQAMWQTWLGILFLALVPQCSGLAISYCSSQNTADGFQGQYSQFMSNGACQDICQGSYTFAVIQGNYCWCSNYIPNPSDDVNTLDCNQDCPGFQSEWCGSTSEGLYGYFQLYGGVPAGTAGGGSSSVAPSPTTASTKPVSASPSAPSSTPPSTFATPTPPSTVVTTPSAETTPTGVSIASVVTVAVQSPVATSSSTVESSSSEPIPVPPVSPVSSLNTPVTVPASTQPSATPSSPEGSSSLAPATETQVYTSVVSVTGKLRTITVTPTATAAVPATTSDPTLGQGSTNSGGITTGKVVGIVLGVALGLGLLIGLGVFFWLKRKHRNGIRAMTPEGSWHSSPHTTAGALPSRQVSQLSSSTLLAKAQSSQNKGLGPSNTTKSAETASSGVDRRSLGTDQRLNPYALYSHEEARASNLSLQDNQDYSRQLRVANPDP